MYHISVFYIQYINTNCTQIQQLDRIQYITIFLYTIDETGRSHDFSHLIIPTATNWNITPFVEKNNNLNYMLTVLFDNDMITDQCLNSILFKTVVRNNNGLNDNEGSI